MDKSLLYPDVLLDQRRGRGERAVIGRNKDCLLRAVVRMLMG
jgi:hypothetical protein